MVEFGARPGQSINGVLSRRDSDRILRSLLSRMTWVLVFATHGQPAGSEGVERGSTDGESGVEDGGIEDVVTDEVAGSGNSGAAPVFGRQDP